MNSLWDPQKYCPIRCLIEKTVEYSETETKTREHSLAKDDMLLKESFQVVYKKKENGIGQKLEPHEQRKRARVVKESKSLLLFLFLVDLKQNIFLKVIIIATL